MTLAVPPPYTPDLPDPLAAQSNLTTAQRLLWLGQKLAPGSPLYNMAFIFTFAGALESQHFQAAFQVLAQRCKALRTVIEEVDGVPQHRVLSQLTYQVPVLDFSAESAPEAVAQSWAERRSQRPFTLAEQLFDTALLQLGPECSAWYLNQHHLITDAESVRLVYETLGDLYGRSVTGTLTGRGDVLDYPLPPTPPTRSIEYWQRQQAVPVSLYQRTAPQVSPHTSRISLDLGQKRTHALKRLALESGAAALTPQLSLFNGVAGIVLAYLHRSSGSPTVAFSTPVHGRTSAALKKAIGVFIELFPLRAEIEPDETFASLFSKTREASGALLRHAQPGASPFAPNRDVNVVLNFIHTQLPPFAGRPVRSEWLHPGASDPHHHLRIIVHDLDNRGSLQLHFDFKRDLFEPELQARAVSHFLALVDGAIANPTQPITQVNLLSDAEHQRLLRFSQSDPVEPPDTVVQRFEAQVAKTPEAIALICEGETLTYHQLNQQANRLAHYLRQQGITAETPVGIYLRRSVAMLVAIWGVLKAGGTYVPIDPQHPLERIAHILQDTEARWVLTHSSLTSCLGHSVTALCLNTLDLDAQPGENLADSPEVDQLAYLLYTSGSTGQPKGVEIEHRSLTHYIQWAIHQYVGSRVLAFPLFSPLAFDLTVTSIYVPLLSGGQIVIYPEEGDGIDTSLQRIVQENAVDGIKLTPSHLALLPEKVLGARVKVLILGGEELKTALAEQIAASSPGIEIYNEYGPTEATVGCTIHRFAPEPDAPPSVSIGKPAAGAEIYLLDEQLDLVPQGTVGEICIGGPGVARGYLNRPELTAERFIDWHGKRLYRTGDLGRWQETGQLTYLGRRDRQVKIRGHRIELTEVEAAIIAHPQVKTCAVRVLQWAPSDAGEGCEGSREKAQLAAYVVGAVTTTDLGSFVARRLPKASVPAYFISLESLPLTANGKIDFAALPHPQGDRAASRPTFVAPETKVEKLLAQVWQQVLGVERVGTQDDFFELGGDSIAAIQIAARLSDLGYGLAPNQIFHQSTVAVLATSVTPLDHPAAAAPKDFALTQLDARQFDKLSALLDRADSPEARS